MLTKKIIEKLEEQGFKETESMLAKYRVFRFEETPFTLWFDDTEDHYIQFRTFKDNKENFILGTEYAGKSFENNAAPLIARDFKKEIEECHLNSIDELLKEMSFKEANTKILEEKDKIINNLIKEIKENIFDLNIVNSKKINNLVKHIQKAKITLGYNELYILHGNDNTVKLICEDKDGNEKELAVIDKRKVKEEMER